MNTVNDVLEALQSLAEPANKSKMEYFGIRVSNTLGVKVPNIRLIAKQLGKNHDLGLELYRTNVHEAQILGVLIMNPKLISEQLCDEIVFGFESWDLCDQACGNLIIKTDQVLNKIQKYIVDEREFVRRTAFVLIVYHFVKTKKLDYQNLDLFLKYCQDYAYDNRIYVKKAISWALRQMGKVENGKKCIEVMHAVEQIKQQATPSARWIASDVQRELLTKFPAIF